ncbi:MAG: hypothetical protein KKA07_01540 [Bacteroidetes bacterium]|nr:hypothetical protein [Bacteroidota bacterium]MBU1717732.1 hypothetical protein [Bacteroidota bacterium]
MKRFLFASIMGFIAFSAICQDVSIEWKSTYTYDQPTDKSSLIYSTADGNEFYMLRQPASISDPLIWIDKYSCSGGSTYTKSLPGNEGTFTENVLFEKILVAKDQFLLFFRGWSKDAKKSSWLVRSFTLDGEYTKEAKELDSHTSQNKLKAGDYNVAVTPDGSMFVLLMTFPFEKGEKEKIRIKGFDAVNLTEKWSKDITMDIESEKGTYNEIAVDDQANVYIVKRIAEGKEFKFHLYILESSAAALKEVAMDIPQGTIIDQWRLVMTPASNLYFTGLYSVKSSVMVDGSFCIKINTSNQQIDLCKFNPFTDRVASEKSSGLTDMKLKDIMFAPSGSFYIIAEEKKESISSKTDPSGRIIYDSELQSNKVVLMCYKSTGIRDWEATISKNQNFHAAERYPALRWDSYIAGFAGDKFCILYNNLNLSDTWKEMDGATCYRSHFEQARYYPFMFVVEPNGNIKYGDKIYGLPLFKFYHDVNIGHAALIPGFAVSSPTGLVIMCGTSDVKQVQLGKVTVK